jgi:hypothetical protein
MLLPILLAITILYPPEIQGTYHENFTKPITLAENYQYSIIISKASGYDYKFDKIEVKTNCEKEIFEKEKYFEIRVTCKENNVLKITLYNSKGLIQPETIEIPINVTRELYEYSPKEITLYLAPGERPYIMIYIKNLINRPYKIYVNGKEYTLQTELKIPVESYKNIIIYDEKGTQVEKIKVRIINRISAKKFKTLYENAFSGILPHFAFISALNYVLTLLLEVLK